jgi:fumarate reductase subunit D
MILLGLLIDEVIKDAYPDSDVLVVFNGAMLYYLGIDLFVRFMLYSLPKINIESYLHLPIKKSKIINFVLTKSVTNVFNVLPILAFIPFTLKVIVPGYSSLVALTWFAVMFIMVINNSFLLHYLKRRFADKPMIAAIFAAVIVLLIVLDKLNIIGLSGYSSLLFVSAANNPISILIPLTLLILVYSINYRYLKSKMTVEDINVKKQKKVDSLSKIKYFDSLGELGEMLMLELKLIWRNKRSRSIIMMSPLFLFYGLLFYPNEDMSNPIALIFVGIFMTGGIMFNYGQYMLGWESSYFDGILANNIDYHKHFRAKYLIIVAMVVLSYVLTIPYAYFGLNILLINTATFLFNLGFLSYLLMYFAANSKTRVDMTKGSAFNYQGMGASNWIMILPFFVLPVLIYLPFSLLGIPNIGIAVIAFIGVVSLALHKSLMKFVIKRFEKRKYIMAKGFREY